MKKEYNKPEIEMINLLKVDIITASGDFDDTGLIDNNTLINGLNDGTYSKFH
jgi:hypothetical protein